VAAVGGCRQRGLLLLLLLLLLLQYTVLASTMSANLSTPSTAPASLTLLADPPPRLMDGAAMDYFLIELYGRYGTPPALPLSAQRKSRTK